MKAQIKLYPCLLSGHAAPAQGAAGDATWPQTQLSPAGIQTLSSYGSRQTGDALGATPFAFLKATQSFHVSLQLQRRYIPIALQL